MLKMILDRQSITLHSVAHSLTRFVHSSDGRNIVSNKSRIAQYDLLTCHHLNRLTNDGNAILREIEVAHPAAKSMIELSRTQDEEVGDGTTSVIILGRSYRSSAACVY